MKKTIVNRELIGQQVVCYVPLTTLESMERSMKVFTVTAVGIKYIKAGRRTFDKHTLRCDNPFCALYLGTPEEFKRYIHLRYNILKKLDEVEYKVGKFDLEQLEELNAVMEKILKNGKES